MDEDVKIEIGKVQFNRVYLKPVNDTDGTDVVTVEVRLIFKQ